MEKNSQDFSAQEAIRMAKTPQGQQMLRQLEQLDREKLQQIAKMASSGDMRGAQALLQTLMGQGGK